MQPHSQPLNTPEAVMVAQAEQNLARDLPLFIEQAPHTAKVCIVGGAPSLKDTLPALQFHKNRGALVLALNNTHDWLIERGIVPDLHVMLDAREKNVEFVQHPRKEVTYLIAAQCHSAVFDALSGFDVLTWVADVPGMRDLADRTPKPIGLIGSGSTVGCKAMALMCLWGFRSISLFGMDGCYRDGAHHAYAQPMNDGETVLDVVYGGKRFACSPWMVQQAEDFENDARELMARGCSLRGYGDGLLQMILSQLTKGLKNVA